MYQKKGATNSAKGVEIQADETRWTGNYGKEDRTENETTKNRMAEGYECIESAHRRGQICKRKKNNKIDREIGA